MIQIPSTFSFNRELFMSYPFFYDEQTDDLGWEKEFGYNHNSQTNSLLTFRTSFNFVH